MGGGGGGFVFQAEDGIRDLVRSRGLGDVYKRQDKKEAFAPGAKVPLTLKFETSGEIKLDVDIRQPCLLYTSDAADERSSVDLGGRRIIKKKTNEYIHGRATNRDNKTQA